MNGWLVWISRSTPSLWSSLGFELTADTSLLLSADGCHHKLHPIIPVLSRHCQCWCHHRHGRLHNFVSLAHDYASCKGFNQKTNKITVTVVTSLNEQTKNERCGELTFQRTHFLASRRFGGTSDWFCETCASWRKWKYFFWKADEVTFLSAVAVCLDVEQWWLDLWTSGQ